MLLASFLALSLITGCGSIQDQAQTNQKTLTESKRYVAKEYDQYRAFMHDQSPIKHPDLAIRLSNEAERVYNVNRAVALVQGNDIIMAIATKPDPLETEQETAKKVRQRLENKEPALSGYNLYITVDQDLHEEVAQVRTNMENQGVPGYSIHQSEPDFNSILQKIQTQGR